MADIEVIHPGLLTTVQDNGRTGYAHDGYPECGAMDSLYYQITNCLVGNRRNEAALECTILGPKLKIHGQVIASVSPNAGLLVNGQAAESGMPAFLKDGDELEVTGIKGCRAILAFRGGIDVPPVLGSRSTDIKTKIGGLDGRPLKAGDRLKVGKPGFRLLSLLLKHLASQAALPVHPWAGEKPAVIHVTLGPQDTMFSKRGLDVFLSSTYTISTDSNRMGLRLEGPRIESIGGHTDILSDGILNGSIQVSAGGLPIIMTADHQTTGGYAKIAVVIPSDLPVLAQLMPGETLRFDAVTEEEALRQYKAGVDAVNQFRKDMKL